MRRSDLHGVGRVRAAKTALHRMTLACGLAGAATLVLAASASASGSPINVATPFSEEAPSVAVDAAGNAVIAWANTKDLAGSKDTVQYCVLPVGATGCGTSGTLTPADSREHVDGVHVLVDGSTIVILADVFGTSGAHSQEFEPVQEWQSTDSGHSFVLLNGGKSVSEGTLSADTVPLSAVIVPGTNELGFGWESAASFVPGIGAAPTFNAFPLTSPPVCSNETCTAGFAALEPEGNPDQVSNGGGEFASQQGASPGVLGIFKTNFSNGPLGCSSSPDFGIAYTFGSGDQSTPNNYNISPGSPNSAWKVPVSEADCDVEEAATAGGPSGFGVLEDNSGTGQTVYHRFDQSTLTFDTPQVTVASEGEQEPSVSQDEAGGVYGTFLGEGGRGGPIRLAYSFDGGNTWSGPNTINANGDLGAESLSSFVNATGQGWAVWTDNGSVFAQSFDAADSVPPPTPVTVTTTQTDGSASGASLTIPAGSVGETDRASLAGEHAGAATGTVSYHLYSSSSCAGSSEVFNGGTAAVTAGSPGASSPVTSALAAGTYYWQASYSGNAGSVLGHVGNDPGASSCGSEVLTVSPAVTIPIVSPPVPVPSLGGTATSTGTTVTVTISCSSVPCTVTITITASSASIAKNGKKAKKLILATGTFTIRRHGRQKLTLHLTKTGKKLLSRHHGHLKATMLVTVNSGSRTVKKSGTIKIVPAKTKHRK